MIKIIKKAIKDRAWDIKDKTLRTILTRNKNTGTLLLAPFNNRKRLTVFRKESDCIIESPTDKKDYYNTEIFEGDAIKHTGHSELLIVKKDKAGKFLLKGKTIAIPLVKENQFDMSIVKHYLID